MSPHKVVILFFAVAFGARVKVEDIDLDRLHVDGAEGASLRYAANGEGEQVPVGLLRAHEGRHLSPDDKVVVIGAGPSGLHMSRELQKRGFNKITILEATDRVGGKSFTRYVDSQDRPCTQRREENGRIIFDKSCMSIEYGTCFLHNAYDRVRDLVHEYKVRREAPWSAYLARAKGFDFIVQIEEEEDFIWRSIAENGGVVTEDLIAQSREHLATFLGIPDLLRNEEDGELFMGAAVEGLQYHFLDGLHQARASGDLTALRNRLSEARMELFAGMDKSKWAPYNVFGVSEAMAKGLEMRGLPPLNHSRIPIPDFVSPSHHFVLYTANALFRYLELRQELFGTSKFQMPTKQFSDAELQQLAKPFREWLVEHGIEGLVPLFQAPMSAQGYGYIWEVPTFYALTWMSGNFFLGNIVAMMRSGGVPTALVRWFMSTVFGADPDRHDHLIAGSTMLPEGYHSIWREMHNAMKSDNGGEDMVQYGITDLNIERHLDDTNADVKVSWKDSTGQLQEDHFKFVIYTAPLKHAHKYVVDLTDRESDIFKTLEGYSFGATTYRVNTTESPVPFYDPNLQLQQQEEGNTLDNLRPWKRAAPSPVIYFTDNLIDQRRSDYTWEFDRNEPLQWGSLTGEYQRNYGTNARRFSLSFVGHEASLDVPGSSSERLAWWGDGSFGSGGTQGEGSANIDSMMKDRLKEDMRKRGLEGVQILEHFSWPYFWHFPRESVEQGMPWELLSMQGQNKMWYLGASASFESINDIVGYNLILLDRSVFTGFDIQSNEDLHRDMMFQDLDGLYDRNSKCCCDADAMCTLVPESWQDPTTLFGCPAIKVSHWPMTPEKEIQLREAGSFSSGEHAGESVEILQLRRNPLGCQDLNDIVILTVAAYVSKGPQR